MTKAPAIQPDSDQARTMADSFNERRRQYRFVVAVARPLLK